MRAYLIAAALAAVAAPAAADPFTYRFTADLASGPLAGQQVSGSFTIDSGLFSFAYSDYVDDAGLGILGLELTIGGASFNVTDADATFLAFERNRLVDFIIGGLPSGFGEIDSADAGADFLLTPLELSYKVAGAGEFIFAGPVVDLVPAPAALLLFGLGVAGLALRRRA